jgi:hypothetical protein
MLPFITIRQDILSHWKRVDCNDASVVALVVSMDPRELRVKSLPSGETLCTTKYIQEMLPLLGCGSERIRKRVQKLVRLGILDSVQVFNKRTGHRLRYLKPSRLYYLEKRRIERAADRSARVREYGVENDPLLLESKTTPDHIYDHKRRDASLSASPPPRMAAGGNARQGDSGKDSAPRCPSCGKVLHYKGWPRCEHCSAELLLPMPKADGGDAMRARSEGKTEVPTYAEQGIDKRVAARAQLRAVEVIQ